MKRAAGHAALFIYTKSLSEKTISVRSGAFELLFHEKLLRCGSPVGIRGVDQFAHAPLFFSRKVLPVDNITCIVKFLYLQIPSFSRLFVSAAGLCIAFFPDFADQDRIIQELLVKNPD